MGLLATYKTWKFVRTLNKIPLLMSKEQFEASDKLLQQATKLFEQFPEHTKKQQPNLEDLLIEMHKLLGSEFRRKLDKQLEQEHSIRIKKNPVQHLHKKHTHVSSKQTLIPQVKLLEQKVVLWKKQGYDTTILEKQLHTLRK